MCSVLPVDRQQQGGLIVVRNGCISSELDCFNSFSKKRIAAFAVRSPVNSGDDNNMVKISFLKEAFLQKELGRAVGSGLTETDGHVP